MKEKLIREVQHGLLGVLDQRQQEMLKSVLLRCLDGYTLTEEVKQEDNSNNYRYLDMFVSAKRVEGCSEKTVDYYTATIKRLLDTVKKEMILTFIDTYRKQMDFAEIVPVSALKKDGLQELIQCIMKYLPYGEPFYDEDTVTDQPIRQIVAELIREKALRSLEDEIPHGIAVVIDQMKYRKHIVDIDATIVCERDSHKGIIIGKQGSMLKKIGSTARYEIEQMLGCKVNLQLWVKVKKDWRDSDFLIKNFGYREDE